MWRRDEESEKTISDTYNNKLAQILWNQNQVNFWYDNRRYSKEYMIQMITSFTC